MKQNSRNGNQNPEMNFSPEVMEKRRILQEEFGM
jgi:hypothetical protein